MKSNPLQRLLRKERWSAIVDIVRRPELIRHATSLELSYPPDEIWLGEVSARRTFMRQAFQYLSFNGILGDYVEFGCNDARTFRMAWSAAQLTSSSLHLWAFDSFAGLPDHVDERDTHPMWVPGAMATSVEHFRALCDEHGIPRHAYTTVPGLYAETLRDGNACRLPRQVALAYVDCDYYSSTRDVLRFLDPLLRTASVIAFDDWFCYSDGRVSGERLAAEERFGPGGRLLLEPYIQYGWHGMSFIVRESRGD